MTDRPTPPRPRRPETEDKAQRLAAALRANLARRKAQKRARDAEAHSATPPDETQGN